MKNQTKKQIRGLMQDPRWPALEEAFYEYIKSNFVNESYKRSNEFDTIWNLAHREGGKYHLNAFWQKLEADVMNLND